MLFSAIRRKRLDILEHTRDVPIPKFAVISARLLTRCLREKSGSGRKKRVPKITNRIIDAAEVREKDYVIWDDELPGFALRVFTPGTRTYVIHYRSAGRSRRYTIGLYWVCTPETER